MSVKPKTTTLYEAYCNECGEKIGEYTEKIQAEYASCDKCKRISIMLNMDELKSLSVFLNAYFKYHGLPEFDDPRDKEKFDKNISGVYDIISSKFNH